MTFLAGGLWFIPLATLLGALYSFYRGYKQSKGGSLVEGDTSGSTVESKDNIPFWACTATIFGYILTVATVAIFFMMKADA